MKPIKFTPDPSRDAGKSQGVNFRTGPNKNKKDKRKKDKLRKELKEQEDA